MLFLSVKSVQCLYTKWTMSASVSSSLTVFGLCNEDSASVVAVPSEKSAIVSVHQGTVSTSTTMYKCCELYNMYMCEI